MFRPCYRLCLLVINLPEWSREWVVICGNDGLPSHFSVTVKKNCGRQKITQPLSECKLHYNEWFPLYFPSQHLYDAEIAVQKQYIVQLPWLQLCSPFLNRKSNSRKISLAGSARCLYRRTFCFQRKAGKGSLMLIPLTQYINKILFGSIKQNILNKLGLHIFSSATHQHWNLRLDL